jgi:ribonucleoside-diphosphate reductase alpha chain
VRRLFTDGTHHPFDLLRWERRTARITGSDGSVVFEQADVEVPEFWSQTATNIVAHKYLHGRLGTPDREGSFRQLISRVVDTMTNWVASLRALTQEKARATGRPCAST